MADIKWQNEAFILEEEKLIKIDELKKAVSEAITAGFDYEIDGKIYHFNYSIDNQINLQDCFNSIQTSDIESIVLNGYFEGVRENLTLSNEVFTKLYMYAVGFKNSLLEHLNMVLIPKVNNSLNINELYSVSFNINYVEIKYSNLKNINHDERIQAIELAVLDLMMF